MLLSFFPIQLSWEQTIILISCCILQRTKKVFFQPPQSKMRIISIGIKNNYYLRQPLTAYYPKLRPNIKALFSKASVVNEYHWCQFTDKTDTPSGEKYVNTIEFWDCVSVQVQGRDRQDAATFQIRFLAFLCHLRYCCLTVTFELTKMLKLLSGVGCITGGLLACK